MNTNKQTTFGNEIKVSHSASATFISYPTISDAVGGTYQLEEIVIEVNDLSLSTIINMVQAQVRKFGCAIHKSFRPKMHINTQALNKWYDKYQNDKRAEVVVSTIAFSNDEKSFVQYHEILISLIYMPTVSQEIIEEEVSKDDNESNSLDEESGN